jgi:phosphoglycerate kinase
MASQFKTIDQATVLGKRVVVRVDWNVTLGKALQIVDDTRIVRTLPTIKQLLSQGASQVILLSHLGKPEGIDPQYTLAPVIQHASRLLGRPITLFTDMAHPPSDVLVMLENLRFWEGEEQNNRAFTQQLAELGELYVNEAFGESHREVASIVGLPTLLPSYAGLWLAEEVAAIADATESPKRPFVVVMGGAKVVDKLKLLEVLSSKADTILLGGKLANEYVAQGLQVTGTARVITPIEGSDLLDIGSSTRELFAREIARAATIVWNGPMGKVEEAIYRAGTEAVFQAISENVAAYTLVGGGDTLAAVSKEEHLTRIDHVSTGGGAMLALIERGSLPGIVALSK